MITLYNHLVIACVNIWAYRAHSSLVKKFYKKVGAWPNIGRPRTYLEKMLWRKVFDHNPLFIVLSDKLKAKAHVQSRCDSLHVPRTLWQGYRSQDIPPGLFSTGVMVKANHGSGFNRYVNSDYNRSELEAEADRWLGTSHGRKHHEWAYSKVERRVFAEEMLWEGGRPVSTELKFHVFGGIVYMCNVIMDRPHATRSCAFRRDGSRIGPIGSFRQAEDADPPWNYPAAVELAERLCEGIDYMRCDLYVLGNRIYFGELTVYPQAGYNRFSSDEVMKDMGALWDLRLSWFLSRPQPGMSGVYARALRNLLDSSSQRRVRSRNMSQSMQHP